MPCCLIFSTYEFLFLVKLEDYVQALVGIDYSLMPIVMSASEDLHPPVELSFAKLNPLNPERHPNSRLLHYSRFP